MKKKILISGLTIISFIVILYLCIGFREKKDFNELKDKIAMEREEHRNTKSELKPEYLDWFQEGEDDFSEEEILEVIDYEKNYYKDSLIFRNTNTGDNNKSISVEEAIDDVNQLFKYFRYCYGGYGYFGGDTVFNEAKGKIIKDIKDNNSIKTSELKRLLEKNLSFILDGHLKFETDSSHVNYTDERFNYLYVYDEEIYRDNNGYYKVNNKDKYYIKAINEEEAFEKYIYPSIDNDGKIIFKIADLDNYSSDSHKQLHILYKFNDEEYSEDATLICSQPMNQDYSKNFELNTEENIPVIKINMFSISSEADASLEDFASSAIDLKNEKAIIMDLRGNLGGRADSGETWIENYTGTKVTNRGAFQYVNSSIMKKVKEELYSNNTDFPTFAYNKFIGEIGEKIDNDNYIFVLMDKYTCSAAELFIEDLMELDNIILVGTNTYGATLCLDLNHYDLRNSNIDASFGNRLYLSPYSEHFDCNGFMPDILVDSNSSLDKVKKLIKYYKLN